MSAYSRASLPESPTLAYPGLTSERRVVLDLAFRGYGLSSEIVNKDGDLLAIADPAAKYDPLPGARVAKVELGDGLQRLQKAGARFDLIVCDIPEGATCAMVGAFAPAPVLAPAGVRRILGTPVVKAPAPRMELALAVWRATQALLTSEGEALLRMPVAYFYGMRELGEPGAKTCWWVHTKDGHADLYIRKNYRVGLYRDCRAAPHKDDRNGRMEGRDGWTPGQCYFFTKTLLPV